MRLAAGARLGRYQVIGPLGRGGMGEVYRATDTQLGREVAIKVLPQDVAEDPVAQKRFEREAKAVAALNHPNILSIYDSGIEHGSAYAVTELLEGETLRSRIARSSLPLDKALEIAAAVADGLAAAHSKQIVHRDLKPENIFLTSDGRVKILDFGLARVMQKNLDSESSGLSTISKVTSPGTVMGTIPYMSPEQVRGDTVDSRSDLFSLGGILYEMLTGRRAFAGTNTAEVSAAILKDEPPDLAGIPPEIQRVLIRCVQKNPDRRFHSAHDLAFALREIQSASTTRAPAAKEKSRLAFWPIGIGLVLFALISLIVVWKVTGLWKKSSDEKPLPKIESLAVLPLDNLSRDDKEQYFADGMTEELIAKLARIRSLRVISRTSVMEYKNARKPLTQIAKELNVDAIVEGSVLQAGNRVRITAQLIHAATDHHLWANSYEGDLADILTLQNQVATAIAEEVQVALAPEEVAQFANVSQVKPEAYQAYLRGLNYAEGMISEENLRLAADFLQKAVDLDPNFAAAYARLSIAESFLYFVVDRTPEHLAKSKAALDKAFQLQPGFAEGHIAAGFYYYRGFRDYERALQEFAIAEKSMPNDKSILGVQATIYRRRGKWEQALLAQQKVVTLNPRDPQTLYDVGFTYAMMRRFPEAHRYFELCISVAPDEENCYMATAHSLLRWKADTHAAREVLKKAPQPKNSELVNARFMIELFERKYHAALEALANPNAHPIDSLLNAGQVHLLLNDQASARAAFEKAYQKIENAIAEKPDDYALRMRLGLALAGLGRKQEAIQEAKSATELLPVSRDAVFGPRPILNLAAVYIAVGEYDAAIDQLEYLLSIPTFLTSTLLRIDPRYDPLRNHPRFKKLLES